MKIMAIIGVTSILKRKWVIGLFISLSQIICVEMRVFGARFSVLSTVVLLMRLQ
ncbi:hypothetical protein [Fusobacterium ulcerans]|uniref:hypothetical protein n=1 Tax=Fusobacterium ulcerans TaxID=861 RepID=UPI002E75FEA3|nr:hypothetical protein [Fusobacterium ulcerans]MEE0136838.1 hypothetical protein [Fusobacterium ulcerans]